MSTTITRREFLLQSALYGGALWALLNLPRPRALAAAAASTTPVVLQPGRVEDSSKRSPVASFRPTTSRARSKRTS